MFPHDHFACDYWAGDYWAPGCETAIRPAGAGGYVPRHEHIWRGISDVPRPVSVEEVEALVARTPGALPRAPEPGLREDEETIALALLAGVLYAPPAITLEDLLERLTEEELLALFLLLQ